MGIQANGGGSMQVGDLVRVMHHCITTNGKLAVVTEKITMTGFVDRFIAHIIGDGDPRSIWIVGDQGEVVCK